MLENIEIPGIATFRLCTLNNEQLIKAVADCLMQMYSEPVKVPSRHIPAMPDSDFDLLVAEMIIRFAENVELLKEIRANDIRRKINGEDFSIPDTLRAKIQLTIQGI